MNTTTCWCELNSPCSWHLAYPDRVPGDLPTSDDAAPGSAP